MTSWKWPLLGFLGVAAIAWGTPVYIAWLTWMPPCTVVGEETIASPDERYVAHGVKEFCGGAAATGDFTVTLRSAGPNQAPERVYGTGDLFDSDDAFFVEWLDATHLQITAPNAVFDLPHRTNYDGIEILYKYPNEAAHRAYVKKVEERLDREMPDWRQRWAPNASLR